VTDEELQSVVETAHRYNGVGRDLALALVTEVRRLRVEQEECRKHNLQLIRSMLGKGKKNAG